MDLRDIEQAITRAGLAPRGAVRLEKGEASGALAGMQSLVLIGFAGRTGWESFAASPEAADGQEHPLDRWSRRVIGDLAQRLGGAAIYPFGGPPYWPFQRWARRAEPLSPSLLGLLIHPVYGLWHSYRGALAFAQDLASQKAAPLPAPCESCVDQPCLTACPVGAFVPGHYDVDVCAEWLRGEAGAECMANGCLARRACPIGQRFAHEPDQAGFTMRAFLASRE